MRNAVRMSAPIAGFADFAYWITYGWMVYQSPLTYGELDFNHDGEVTYREADYAPSFGTRTFVGHGRQCTEYLAYKDGLPLKMVCHD